MVPLKSHAPRTVKVCKAKIKEAAEAMMKGVVIIPGTWEE